VGGGGTKKNRRGFSGGLQRRSTAHSKQLHGQTLVDQELVPLLDVMVDKLEQTFATPARDLDRRLVWLQRLCWLYRTIVGVDVSTQPDRRFGKNGVAVGVVPESPDVP